MREEKRNWLLLMDFEIEGKTLEWIWRKTSLKRVFRVFHCVLLFLFFQLSENYSNSLTSSFMLNMFPFQFFSFIFITFWIDKLAPFLRRVDANTVDAWLKGVENATTSHWSKWLRAALGLAEGANWPRTVHGTTATKKGVAAKMWVCERAAEQSLLSCFI